jgi:hypothetical protein
MIDNRRNLVIGAYAQKFLLKLVTLDDINGNDPVGQFQLFQHDGNFASVRGTPGIKVDTCLLGHDSVLLLIVNCAGAILTNASLHWPDSVAADRSRLGFIAPTAEYLYAGSFQSQDLMTHVDSPF